MFVFFFVKVCGIVGDFIYYVAFFVEFLYIVIFVYDDVVDDFFECWGFFFVNVFWKNKIVVFVGDYFFLQGLLFVLKNKEY